VHTASQLTGDICDGEVIDVLQHERGALFGGHPAQRLDRRPTPFARRRRHARTPLSIAASSAVLEIIEEATATAHDQPPELDPLLLPGADPPQEAEERLLDQFICPRPITSREA
jgi:hypothetical protein